MRKGLYGKLPARRDFIAVSASREFLLVWEAWLQGGVSASMMTLGPGWQAAFLRAPIWRFWLGAEVCGEPVIGALMPSLDGVGRYFPLTLFVRATDGAVLPPPEFEPQTTFFAAAEALLLATLDDGATLEQATAALENLPLPSDRLPPFAWREARPLAGGAVLVPAGREGFSEVFAATRCAGHAAAYASMTFWWTAGGEGFPALAIAQRRMPDPYLFTGMLTGDFDALRA